MKLANLSLHLDSRSDVHQQFSIFYHHTCRLPSIVPSEEVVLVTTWYMLVEAQLARLHDPNTGLQRLVWSSRIGYHEFLLLFLHKLTKSAIS